MDQIALIFEAIASDGVTHFFCSFIFVWWLSALILLPFSREERSVEAFVSITPNGLATLGVLGTFTGVLLGLLDFDVTQVDGSIPALLSGLKIAFTTSIVGMSAALTFRVIKALALSGVTSDEITFKDLHDVLQEMRDIAALSKSQLDSIRSAFGGDENTSISNEIQQLRHSVQDGDKKIVREFENFSEHMVESNQKAIIEALQEVVTDFNTALTEQFGENFTRLNEGVESLVAWQDRYRTHVEALEARHGAAVTAIEDIEIATSGIRSQCEGIPAMLEPLRGVLEGLEVQTVKLEAQLRAVADLRDSAVDAFPMIEENLEKLTTRLGEAVDGAVRHSQQALNDGATAQAEVQSGLKSYIEGAQKARETFAEELDYMLRQMKERTSKEFAQHNVLVKESAKEAQKLIQEGWAQSSDKMNDHMNAFDREMQKEITRVIGMLGNNLASLSEKFVEDYTPLTERLREVVALAEKIDSPQEQEPTEADNLPAPLNSHPEQLL